MSIGIRVFQLAGRLDTDCDTIGMDGPFSRQKSQQYQRIAARLRALGPHSRICALILVAVLPWGIRRTTDAFRTAERPNGLYPTD
ncbi:MAG: hypothetical protein G4V63_24745 [Candidatus Afipia apatlaquensis]|uniref:Uncharacterized protein n=1 Tax=Candidatus Afipia apatlaquensis TaxID=2712852 RepID=A0A7C9RIS5_9BRAD|nr:hypothetical protein [Candidatus Afipia apatlaquensis]